MRVQELLLFEGQRLLHHRRRLALGLANRLDRERMGAIDRAQLVFLSAGDVAEGVVHLARRVYVQQMKGHHLDAGSSGVEAGLDRVRHLLLDLGALRGVHVVNGDTRHYAAERCQARTAHEDVGLGDVERVGDRIHDAVLDRPAQVDELPIAGQQQQLVGRRLFLKPGVRRFGCARGRSPAGPAWGDCDRRDLRAGGRVVFDALHAILGDHVVRAERPRRGVVPAWCERGRHDLSEAQTQADFARAHREQPAGQVHRRRDRDAGDRCAAHRHPQTRHGRQSIAQPDPFAGRAGAADAGSERRDQDECAGDLEPIRDERRGRAERCARIHSPRRGRPN